MADRLNQVVSISASTHMPHETAAKEAKCSPEHMTKRQQQRYMRLGGSPPTTSPVAHDHEAAASTQPDSDAWWQAQEEFYDKAIIAQSRKYTEAWRKEQAATTTQPHEHA